MSKEVPLTQGKVAIVDDEDYDLVMRFKWFHRLGYARRNVNLGNGKRGSEFLHHLILRPPVGMFVDHINGDSLDNRRENLRICTMGQNSANTIKYKTRASSRFKGVSWRKDASKWGASIRVEGKQQHLGFYTSEIEAACAYDAAARQVHGEFARLNFPQEEERSAMGRVYTDTAFQALEYASDMKEVAEAALETGDGLKAIAPLLLAQLSVNTAILESLSLINLELSRQNATTTYQVSNGEVLDA